MERNKNGTIKKGAILNPNGRPKGTPNKTTSELKETLKSIIDKELEQLDKHLKKLDPKERLDFITKLLPYVVPKQSEVKGEVKMNENTNKPRPDLSILTDEELEFMERVTKKLDETII